MISKRVKVTVSKCRISSTNGRVLEVYNFKSDAIFRLLQANYLNKLTAKDKDRIIVDIENNDIIVDNDKNYSKDQQQASPVII